MSRIAPLPLQPKTATLTDKEERRYMDTFRHAERCEGCYRPNDGTIVGAHLNTVSGGSGKAIKSVGAIVALCAECHALIDGRVMHGSVEWTQAEKARTIFRIAASLAKERAARWRELS